uniref:Uncharacterized protein n=1 Tax=uncultured marine virus TaxID=186617 RepID=A0A0F7LBM5_9VIRU|nr:hypothetical protein [uncultured marine virus]
MSSGLLNFSGNHSGLSSCVSCVCSSDTASTASSDSGSISCGALSFISTRCNSAISLYSSCGCC